ncbi:MULTISPECIES: VOC family protein [Streptomyces]|uniref:VOC family protein n=1 Tax=Streptomyces evansiae TaxID=3075535 RepID=A0ABU2QZ22_9ACTN|nr:MULTISPECIES: VOC family protein [unclassified Streptomyces]MDT0409701.1 VOC family protein [Streptomyces sp. DSM 41979]MYQ60776.1 VOC family protein [Streptomyces sp. SID4926]
MSVALNHTIVHARDNRESAEFFAGLLGLEITAEWGPFVAVALSNGVTLDFATIPADRITPQHYAFLVSEEEFTAAYEQIKHRGIEHYADPHQRHPGTINHNDGGHGVYFTDPAGHAMELITVPYGGWDA